MGKKLSKEEQRRKGVDRRLQKKYGITLDEYEKMFKAQGNVCAICKNPPRQRVLYVTKVGKKKVQAKTLERLHKKCKKLKLKSGLVKKEVTTIRQAVDHAHKFKYMKVVCVKGEKGKWSACIPSLPNIPKCTGKKKSVAMRKIRLLCIRASVRGIICYPCNAGLRKFRDNHEYLASAAKYLKRHHKNSFGGRNGNQ